MDGNPFTSWFGKVAGALAIIVYGASCWPCSPRRTEIGFMTAMAKPWKSLFFGVLAASTFVGLVLVLLASLVGIPLVPVALVLLVLAALTGFVAGTYFVADRVLGAFRYETDTLWKRIGALTIGLIAVWILGIIPFLGWLLPFALGLYGLGAPVLFGHRPAHRHALSHRTRQFGRRLIPAPSRRPNTPAPLGTPGFFMPRTRESPVEIRCDLRIRSASGLTNCRRLSPPQCP